MLMNFNYLRIELNMYELDTNLLRDEAQRLLKQEIKVLEQIQSTPNLIDC